MIMSAALTTGLVAAHFAGPWVWGPWFLLIPLFWITLFVVLFLVFGRRWRRRANPGRQAETTLAERFAKGDIDEVEYRARLEVLRANDDS
jgi:putative membrane protein